LAETGSRSRSRAFPRCVSPSAGEPSLDGAHDKEPAQSVGNGVKVSQRYEIANIPNIDRNAKPLSMVSRLSFRRVSGLVSGAVSRTASPSFYRESLKSLLWMVGRRMDRKRLSMPSSDQSGRYQRMVYQKSVSWSASKTMGEKPPPQTGKGSGYNLIWSWPDGSPTALSGMLPAPTCNSCMQPKKGSKAAGGADHRSLTRGDRY
jgi:hypothetical protein